MILYEFDKGDKQAPWVGSVYYQPFQQDSKKEIKIHTVNNREGDWHGVRYAVKSQATIASTMGRGGNSVNAQTKGKKVTKTGRNVSSSEQTKYMREAWMGSWRELAPPILARSALTRASSSRVHPIKYNKI